MVLLSVHAFIARAACSPRVKTAKRNKNKQKNVSAQRDSGSHGPSACLCTGAPDRRHEKGAARRLLTLLLPRVELLAKLVRGALAARVGGRVLALVHHARQAGDE